MEAAESAAKRYACPEDGCDKVFSSSSHMRRHVRNHRDDRAFTCTHCGQAFIRREVWKRHEALHINPQSSRPRIKPIRKVDSSTSPPRTSSAGRASPTSSQAQTLSSAGADMSRSTARPEGPSPPQPREVHLPPLAHAQLPPMQFHDFSASATAHLHSQAHSHSHSHSHHSHHNHSHSHSHTYQPHTQHERMASGDEVPPPLYLSFPSGSQHSQPHTQTQLIQPWPVNEASNFNNHMDAASSIFPQLGIENWLDQILSNQAGFSAVMASPVTPQQAVAPQPWNHSNAGPSTQEAEACMSLRDWFSEHGGKEHASALDPKRFSRCLGAYWSTVDMQYPILHRPTFSTGDTPPLLMLSVVLLGATVSGVDEDWTWAEAAFPYARGLAFMPCGLDGRDRLHNLQCLTLLSLVGHAMGQDAQDHAHALLSAALTIARRSNLYEDRTRSTQMPAHGDDLQSQWHHWILDESTRRVAWLILMRDIEYASFFHQLPSRATSPFRLPVDLPCPEACWEAPNAQLWSRTYIPGETLAAALKKAIHQGAPGTTTHAPDTEFAQLVLIYGLCALGWDVNKRDLIAPEVLKSGPTAVNQFLLQSFTTSTLEDTTPPRTRKQECLRRCIQDVALLAALECHMNTLYLQVFVGVTEISTLQPVRPTDWIESRKAMQKWSSSEESGAAVALAAQFLARAIKCEQEPTFNGAWAIYNAFLVCWSYYVLRRTTATSYMRPSNVTAKDDALQCTQVLRAWVQDGEDEPEPLLMRALSTHVVLMLSSRQEVMIKSACALVDRHAIP